MKEFFNPGLSPEENLPTPEHIRTSVRELVIAEPHGLCRGAEVAIDMLDKTLEIIDGREPLYFHNDLLHNHRLMADFEKRGAKVIRDRTPTGDWDWSSIPDNALYGISAHGARPSDTQKALEKGCMVMDFTCLLVDSEHKKVSFELAQGKEMLLFGKRTKGKDGASELHPESRGTLGFDSGGKIHFIGDEADLQNMEIDPSKQYVWVNQTTMATDQIADLRDMAREMIPGIKIAGRGQGCYATDDRQAAVVSLAAETDAFLVVTSDTSNNGSNLVKRAEQEGVPSYLIQGVQDLEIEQWFPEGSGIAKVGISSAASTIEQYLQEVVAVFEASGVSIRHQLRSNSREPNPFTLKRANIEGLCSRYGIPLPITPR